jgi:hypothetical protein
MMFWRKHPVEAPEGVRVYRGDGSVIEFDVIRDPRQDKKGCACWVAVPRESFVFDMDTDSIAVAFMPARSDLVFDLRTELWL